MLLAWCSKNKNVYWPVLAAGFCCSTIAFSKNLILSLTEVGSGILDGTWKLSINTSTTWLGYKIWLLDELVLKLVQARNLIKVKKKS